MQTVLAGAWRALDAEACTAALCRQRCSLSAAGLQLAAYAPRQKRGHEEAAGAQHVRESPFNIGRPGRQRQKTEGLPESPRLLDRCGWDRTGSPG